jgi:glycosyltransferase involved in cell wall biosynthesis
VRALKRRLLFIVESGTDVRLVEGLAEHFDLTLIARKIEGGVEISQPTSAKFNMAIGPGGRASFGRFVFFELLRRRSQTDVVLVQGYSVAALAANAARMITSAPTTMLVCSPIEAYYRCRLAHANGPSYRRHEAFTLDLLARANALTGDTYVVLSDYLKNVVRAHGARSVHNIPIYGVDTQVFCPPTKSKSELKSELGLPTEGTLIFFSSRIAPEKDSETLLRAFRRLIDQGENLWLLHRSGGYRQFRLDAEGFGVGSRVIATDAVHPHRGLSLDYQACDVCVQASRAEGLGFSPLEALACATPVIATSAGGLRETILDGKTGWSYPAGDDMALATSLSEVIANPAEAARRARCGREMIVKHFDRTPVFERFVQLTETLIARNAPEFARSAQTGA